MKNLHRLKSNDDFSIVFKRGKSFADAKIVLYSVKRNDDLPYRVGFSVGKRIGNAVIRNRYKRILREVVRLNSKHIPIGIDIVIIARAGILGHRFNVIEKSFIRLMKKASLWVE